MITTITHQDKGQIEVRADGNRDQIESDLIAIMIYALADFTPEDLEEMLEIAIGYRQEEPPAPLPPIN